MLLHFLQRHLACHLPCRTLWCIFTHSQAEEPSPIDKLISLLHHGPVLVDHRRMCISKGQRKGNQAENTRGDTSQQGTSLDGLQSPILKGELKASTFTHNWQLSPMSRLGLPWLPFIVISRKIPEMTSFGESLPIARMIKH